jgi:hypothetical protein
MSSNNRLALSCLADAWFFGQCVPHAKSPSERRAYMQSALVMHRRGMLLAQGASDTDPVLFEPVPFPTETKARRVS